MKNLILVGMPASGKTTIAGEYARAFGGKVRDTDEYIVENYGNISEIFEKFGEEYFRKTETEALKTLCEGEGILISTGGGCVMRDRNVQIMKSSGKIVYLRARIETLLERTRGDLSRPLLFGDREQKLKKLYRERVPVYERVADIILDTDELSPREAAKYLRDKFSNWSE